MSALKKFFSSPQVWHAALIAAHIGVLLFVKNPNSQVIANTVLGEADQLDPVKPAQ